MSKAVIYVSTYFVGIHCWPSAPENRAYLRSPHRHRFGVRVSVAVEELDREIEFHDLQDFVRSHLPEEEKVTRTDHHNPYLSWSCEHHARHLLTVLSNAYPNRNLSVAVDEDEECGAVVRNYE